MRAPPQRPERASSTWPRRLGRAATRTLLSGACLLQAPQAAPREVAIAVTPSLLALPIEVAQRQGYFAAEGVAVRAVGCASGPLCLQMLFDQTVPLATTSEIPVVFNSFQRSDYAVVATLATASRNLGLVMRKAPGPAGPHQLQGKRIGVVVGSSSQYFLDSFLLYHGIDPKLVTFVPMQANALAQALVDRRIDAMATSAKQIGPVLQKLGAEVTVLDSPRIYSETYNLIADRRVLHAGGDDLVKVLRALERAQRYIAERPLQAKVLMQATSQLEASYIESIYAGFAFRLGLDQSLLSTMEGEARWAQREGHVAAGLPVPNYLNFVEPAPLRKAVPSVLER